MITEAPALRIAEYLRSTVPYASVLDHAVIKEWKTLIIDNAQIAWSPVISVENTGKKEDGYDLTVPGYETFMSVDGVILSNTMQFHVPVSPEAVTEARDKMMPSSNLKSAATFKPMYNPRQEFLLGLYLASQKNSKKAPRIFTSKEAVKAAYTSGKLKASDPVIINEV